METTRGSHEVGVPMFGNRVLQTAPTLGLYIRLREGFPIWGLGFGA